MNLIIQVDNPFWLALDFFSPYRVSISKTHKGEISEEYDFVITEGLHHHEDQVVVALNLVDNGHEYNEGVVLWLFSQHFPHDQWY